MSLAPPPHSGNAAFDRWMFLLWEQINDVSSTPGSFTTSSTPASSPTISAILDSPQMGNLFVALQSFTKPETPGPRFTAFNDSQSILANQIFGA